MDLELTFNDYLLLFDISRTQHGFFCIIRESPSQAERKLEDEALNLSTYRAPKMALVIKNRKEIVNNTITSSSYVMLFLMFLPKIFSLTRRAYRCLFLFYATPVKTNIL